MLGIPTTSVLDANDTFAIFNPYYSGYVQDAWRVSRSLTINVGLRLEFEKGITERYDRMIAGWDPALKLKITDAAVAAYAARPLAEVPAAAFWFRADPSIRTPRASAAKGGRARPC